MKTIRLNKNNPLPPPCVATIGFFDGVHRGHQYLIKQVIDEAAASGMESTAITFDCHPRQVLKTDYIPKQLSTTEGKLILLSRTNVDNTAVLSFDCDMASMSARYFMKEILSKRLNVRKLIIGYDNRFGHNRSEGFNEYARYGREIGMELIQANAFTLHGYKVSSSIIRTFLLDGEIEMANTFLGYPYTIMGRVVKGYRNGHRMGFPTANIDPQSVTQLIPQPGVYAVRARIENSMSMHPGMMNIGNRPTFCGHDTTLETNIFNFSDNIYGNQMYVSFLHRIRGEQKFECPEELMAQLHKDREIVEKQFFKKEQE